MGKTGTNSINIVILNTFFQLLTKILSSFTTLLVTFIIILFFGVTAYGSFIKITTFVTFFYLILDFGMNAMFLKDYFRAAEHYLSFFLQLRVIVALTLIALIAIFVLLLPYNFITGTGFSPEEKTGILLFSVTLIGQALLLSANLLMQKKLSYQFSLLPSLVSSLVIIIGSVVAGLYKNLYLVFFSYGAGSFVFFLFFLLLNKKMSSRFFSPTHSLPGLGKFLKSSFPLGLMLFINLVYFRADILILSFMKPNIDIGIYGFSYKIFEFIIAIPVFFSNSAYPILIRQNEKKESLYPYVKKYLFILFVLSLFFLVIVFEFAPAMVYLRQNLYSSILPLRILSLSFPFFFMTGLLQWIFVLKNKVKVLLLIYLVCLCENIILNLIYIPKYSYLASSYITVLSEATVFFAMVSILLKTKYHKRIIRKAIAVSS